MSSGKSGSGQFPDAEKRILAAARKEFIAKGLAGARMQAVADEAGVNKALLHYYFRNKEKLYGKVVLDTMATVWGAVAAEFRSQKPDLGLEPLLRIIVSTYVRVLAANPDFPLFMFREIAGGGASLPADLKEKLREFEDVPATLARTLKEEIRAGKVKPIPPVHFLMNLMGMTVSTFLLRPLLRKWGPALGIQIEFDQAFLAERIEYIADTMLNGIRIKR